MFSPYPHSGFCEICPGSNFLPGRHVGISVARKCCFQLLKLLACEMRSLPPLSLLFLVIVWCAVVHFAFRQILCKDKTEFLCTFFGVKSCFKIFELMFIDFQICVQILVRIWKELEYTQLINLFSSPNEQIKKREESLQGEIWHE